MTTTLQVAALLFVSIGLGHSAAPPYGQLSVKGTKLVGSGGQEVALHGMSLFWSQWSEGAIFFNKDTVQALKTSWNSNLVRATMGVEEGGYLTNPSGEQAKVEAVVQAAIDLGIYVIIDWHDHNAQNHPDQAVAFFSAISKKYAGNPHILYEVFNEPLQVDWNNVLVPYHNKVVAAIRANDKDNIIILGTPTWSQDVDVAANNPVAGTNLMYTLHYYAATHKQSLRDKAQAALNKGIAIFVTEYGLVDASGGGSVDTQSSNEWWAFLDQNRISYANWAIDNKAEAAAALTPGTNAQQVGDDSRLTASGQLVKQKLKSQDNGLSGTAPVSTIKTTVKATTSKTTVKATTSKITTVKATVPAGQTTVKVTVAAGQTTVKAADPTTQKATTVANGGGNNGGGSSGISASVATVNSWSGGGQYKLVFKNTGSSAVCGVDFTLTLPAGGSIQSNWNFSPTGGNEYSLPTWVNIAPGNSFEDAGLVVSGDGALGVGGLEVKNC